MLWVDLIFGAKTSSQTDKRVKLVKPVKQKERRGGHRARGLLWAHCLRLSPCVFGPPVFDRPPTYDGPLPSIGPLPLVGPVPSMGPLPSVGPVPIGWVPCLR